MAEVDLWKRMTETNKNLALIKIFIPGMLKPIRCLNQKLKLIAGNQVYDHDKICTQQVVKHPLHIYTTTKSKHPHLTEHHHPAESSGVGFRHEPRRDDGA